MSARLTVDGPAGTLDFHCFDNWLSRTTSEEILAGRTYPLLSTVREVRTVVDIGANCGAASVFFATAYPEATVHAVEPAAATFEVLERNAAVHQNLIVHRLGLHSADQRLPLHHGAVDGVTSSLTAGEPGGSSEMIDLRAADAWLTERGIETIDVLKVDVEGCELEILEAIRPWLPAVKVIYIEYGGLETRHRLEALLAPTHAMAIGRIMLTHGEAVYVASGLVGEETEAAIGALVAEAIVASRS